MSATVKSREGEDTMTNAPEHLGPVSYAVIEFEGSIDPSVPHALTEIVANGSVHILDLAVVSKDEEGQVEIVEVTEVEEASDLHALAEFITSVIASEDVIQMAEVLEPGRTALLAVWEDTWAIGFAEAIRSSGGEMVASGRIPADAIAEALVEAIEN